MQGLSIEVKQKSVRIMIENTILSVLIDPNTGLFTLTTSLIGILGGKVIVLIDIVYITLYK